MNHIWKTFRDNFFGISKFLDDPNTESFVLVDQIDETKFYSTLEVNEDGFFANIIPGNKTQTILEERYDEPISNLVEVEYNV